MAIASNLYRTFVYTSIGYLDIMGNLRAIASAADSNRQRDLTTRDITIVLVERPIDF
jgi:hypothetical protein